VYIFLYIKFYCFLGMMPFWVFTLGRYIFAQGKIAVPYHQIGIFVVSLIIPLAIGCFIQKKFPRISKILIRIMKPFSVILILFIIIFAIITNLYIFKLFSWEVRPYFLQIIHHTIIFFTYKNVIFYIYKNVILFFHLFLTIFLFFYLRL